MRLGGTGRSCLTTTLHTTYPIRPARLSADNVVTRTRQCDAASVFWHSNRVEVTEAMDKIGSIVHKSAS